LISNDENFKFPFIVHRKVRSYPKYVLHYDGSPHIKESKLEVPIRFKPGTRTIDVNSLFFGGYNKSPNARFIGFTPFHVGYAKGFQVPQNSLLLKWVSLQKEELRYFLTKEIFLKETFMISGGYNTNIPHILSYGLRASVKIETKVFRHFIKHVNFNKFFKMPKCRDPVITDMDYLKINPNAFTGIMCSHLYGGKRSDCIDVTLPISKVYFKMLRSMYIRNVGLWSIGAREKDVNVDEDNFSTRLVSMPEQVPLFAWLVYAQNFTRTLMSMPESDIWIGRNFTYKNCLWLRERFSKWAFAVSIDFKNFDQSCTKRFIRIACGILRQSFSDSKENDYFFANLCESIVTKFYCLPPGIVYRITKGIPSGHAFTSIIGSMINKIAFIFALWLEYGDSINFHDYMEMIVSGDDGMILVNDLRVLAALQRNLLKLGFTIKEDMVKEALPLGSNDFDLSPKFLKKHINNFGEPGWNWKAVFKRIFNPVHSKPKITDLIDVVNDYIIDSPFDAKLTNYLISYREFLIEELKISYPIARHENYDDYSMIVLNNSLRVGYRRALYNVRYTDSLDIINKYRQRIPIQELYKYRRIPVRLTMSDIIGVLLWYMDSSLFYVIKERLSQNNYYENILKYCVSVRAPPFSIHFVKEGDQLWPHAYIHYNNYQHSRRFETAQRLGMLSTGARFSKGWLA